MNKNIYGLDTLKSVLYIDILDLGIINEEYPSIILYVIVRLGISLSGYFLCFFLYYKNMLFIKFIPINEGIVRMRNIIIIIVLSFAFFTVENIHRNVSQDTVYKADGEIYFVLLSILVVAPIFEEILFRGIIFKNFLKVKNMLVSSIVTSIIFAVCHPLGHKTIWAFLFSMLMCITYYSTKNILISIIGHFTFNSSIFIYAYMENIRYYQYQ